ncbi:MAG: hypothetical protein LBL43_03260, partial [Treponema sp.]|nr:hypothetical protein [Treponema sp.]
MMKKGMGVALILTAALMSLSCAGMVPGMIKNANPHVWDEALPTEESAWILVDWRGGISGILDGITAYNGTEVRWMGRGSPLGTWFRIPPGPASFVGNLSRNDGSIIYRLRGAEFSFDFTETGNPQELTGKYYLLWLGQSEDVWGLTIYLIDIE